MATLSFRTDVSKRLLMLLMSVGSLAHKEEEHARKDSIERNPFMLFVTLKVCKGVHFQMSYP